MPRVSNVAMHITPYIHRTPKKHICLFRVRCCAPQYIVVHPKKTSIPGIPKLVAFLEELGTSPERVYTFLDSLQKPSTSIFFDELDTAEFERLLKKYSVW
jgi:hypothetical protein